MWSELRKLAQHSLIYTSGVILTKAAGFLLIPIYTHYLTTADYGVLELLSLTVDLASIVFAVGLGWSVLRVYSSQESEAARREVFSTAFFFFAAMGIVGMSALMSAARPLSRLVFGHTAYAPLLVLMLIAGCCELVAGVPLAHLRARKRSGTWVLLTSGRAAAGMALNILMLAGFHLGVKGIVYANVTASSIFFLLFVGISVPWLTVRFSRTKLKEMLAYGWPLVPSGLFMFVLHFSDRFFLRRFGSIGEVGLYSLGYRFGMIQSVLVTQPFLLMWSSLMFSVTKRDDARQIVSRLLTYYGVVAIWFGLAISVLIQDILAVMVAPAFRPAHMVVPVLSLGFVFLGLAYVLSTGIFVSETTGGHAVSTGIAATTNVVFNLLLIPRYGMMGAAIATSASFAVMATTSCRIASRLYPVRFEWDRVARTLAVAGAVFAASRMVPLHAAGSLPGVGARLAMVLAFPLLLYLTGFYRREELARLRSGVRALSVRRVLRRRSTPTESPGATDRSHQHEAAEQPVAGEPLDGNGSASAAERPSPMRRVLMIAYHFAPSGAVAAHIATRTARYLPRFGWQPIVLTVREWHAKSRVADGAQLPLDGMQVRRTGMLYPLRAYDSVARVIARRGSAGHGPGAAAPEGARRTATPLQALHQAVRTLLSLPDPEMAWLPFAMVHGLAIARSRKVDAIQARGMPWTALIAGCLLKRLTGLPLIVEFADPWVTNPWRPAPRGWVERSAQRARERMERWVIERADRVVVTTDQLRREFGARYPNLDPKRFVTIPVGYDPATFPVPPVGPSRPSDRFVITHAGSLYGMRSPAAFLQALSRLLRNGVLNGRPIEVRLLGAAGGDALDGLISELGLQGVVHCLPPCSHEACLRQQVESDLLLLLQPRTTVQVPAKAYEYLGSGRPILALTPENGATAELIRSTGAGMVASAESIDQIAEALMAFWHRTWAQARDARAIAAYQEPAITEHWARLLESVCRDAGILKETTHP